MIFRFLIGLLFYPALAYGCGSETGPLGDPDRAVGNGIVLYLDAEKGAEFPVRVTLRRCLDGLPAPVPGWRQGPTETVVGVFWSDNLQRFLVSTHDQRGHVAGEPWYGEEDPRVYGSTPTGFEVLANRTVRGFVDAAHHPVVLLHTGSHFGARHYLDRSGAVKPIANSPRHGLRASLPEARVVLRHSRR